MADDFVLEVRFYQLAEHLQPYFTPLHCFCMEGGPDALLSDRVHPQWAALRFRQTGRHSSAGIYPDSTREVQPFFVTGPTSRAIMADIRPGRVWGIGIKPAGWSRYISAPANKLADRIVDGTAEDGFEGFVPILEVVQRGGSESELAEQIIDHLQRLEPQRPNSEEQVLACHEVLLDPEVSDVVTLAERVGVQRRTLERLCARNFGFSPKTLLRRQRFLRSLARFVIAPHQHWTKVLDGQYVDQAHFVRDFRSFMGVTPSEFAESRAVHLDPSNLRQLFDHGVFPPSTLSDPSLSGAVGKSGD